jgi:predicted nucleotidyltransferase component of viral defense system
MTTSASIRARLKNISRENQIPFQLLIYRYLHERLFFRVSISSYRNNLILKGGNLLFANQGLLSRPTRDVDFLAVNVPNDIDDIRSIFTNLCSINYSDDKVTFDSKSIEIETISEHDKYSGLRVFMIAEFDTIRQKIQIDIGYGDIVIPTAQFIDYPILLDDMEIPVIKAYSNETVIAEKFQAMIELSELNSRMKDFYDIYTILISKKYDRDILKEAITNTFKQRNTNYIEGHSVFSEAFVLDENRNVMWKAFLKKINDNSNLEFAEVMIVINISLKPIWEEMSD